MGVTAAIGVWETSKHVRAGDYEQATKTALSSALKVGVAWGAGVLAGAVCAGVTLGAGSIACVALAAGVAGLAGSYLADKVGDAAGGHVYAGIRNVADKAGSFVGAARGTFRRDVQSCVGKTDGFITRFCSLYPFGKLAVKPSGLAVDRAREFVQGTGEMYRFVKKKRRFLIEVGDKLVGAITDIAVSPAAIETIQHMGSGTAAAQSGARHLNAVGTVGGFTGGAGPAGNGESGGRVHGASSNASRVTAKDLRIHVQVGGQVSTTARSGDRAITAIGAVTRGSGKVGGTHITRIGGSVHNRGGVLEINPVKGCRVRRDGRCCLEIHRARCVIDKYKRPKKRSCARGYKRSGSYCYEYSDRRHSLGR